MKATPETIKALKVIVDYIAYGYPTKKVLNDIIRKRGFLKKGDKKVAITDNIVIEELLGESTGCICLEDLIEAYWDCSSRDDLDDIKQVMWPI